MKDETTCFETNYVSIAYNSEKKYILIVWKKFANDDEQMLFREKLLAMIKTTQTASYLTDNTKLAGTSERMQRWIRDTWFPLANQAGLKNVAAVQSKDKFAAFAVENIVSGDSLKKMNYKQFNSIEEAEIWLASLS